MKRNTCRILGLGAAILGLTMAQGAFAQMPDDLSPGTRVELEGRIFDMGTLLAMEIAVLRAPTGEDAVKGGIQEVDHAKKRLTVAGVTVDCRGDCFVAGANGRPLPFEKIETGKRAKVTGVFEGGVFKGDYIKIQEMKPGKSGEAHIEGRIAAIDRESNTFTINGISVQVTPKTLIELE